ncbi:MAG TPA: hypothetical protein VJX92_12725 [Methylomirabilota bacterium]|nr:hypothetical protein [Methylomirabilota bacterium]
MIKPAGGPLAEHQPRIEVTPAGVVGYVAIAEPVRELPVEVVGPPSIVERLDALSIFVPRSIRAPALGDLYEDLGRMRARGSSRAAMWWAAAVQVALLVLSRLIPACFRR